MTDYILKDWDGNYFISITNKDENTLMQYEQLTHCLAVVKVDGDYLLGWNKWRNRWEIFGGCIDKGETPRECIVRECYEELGIEEIYHQINDRAEIVQLAFYKDIKDKEPIAPIDEKLLEYYIK